MKKIENIRKLDECQERFSVLTEFGLLILVNSEHIYYIYNVTQIILSLTVPN